MKRECQHLLIKYVIMCDLNDIAPFSLIGDGAKCDMIIIIREARVLGSTGYFMNDEDAGSSMDYRRFV